MVKHEMVYSIKSIRSPSPRTIQRTAKDLLEALTKDADEIISPDHLLWNALALIGINIEKNAKSCLKCFIWTGRVLILIAVLHLLGITIAYIFSDHHKPTGAFMLYLSIFYPLLFLAHSRMARIYSLLPQIYGYRILLKVPSYESISCLITLLPQIVTTFLTYTVIGVYIVTLSDEEKTNFWLYSVVIESQPARYLLYVLGYFSYCCIMSFMPFLITLVVCSVEYRCSEILKAINKQLQMRTEADDEAGIQWLAEIYLDTIDVLQNLRDILSPLLFFQLLCNVMGLLMWLYWIILFPGMDRSDRIAPIQTVVVCTTVMMMVSQVLCGSWIPAGTEQIGETARLLVARKKDLGNKDAKIFFHLEKFENVEPVHMTAGGVVKIRKKLILNVLGALFTYVLLIMNMKR